ncbi:MAG: hypothetical protein ACREB7_17955 [Sphingopyxis sp.]|uniref:hypothetical protein n=1 Tax=Sphingopyxis sp. TaxID=1908224 RepID=UPI003D6CD86B
MKAIITGLALAFAAVPAAASEGVDMRFECGATAAEGGETPNLHGNWDFLMAVGGEPSFGLMSIGFVGDAYRGSLTPVRTAPVVLRSITLTGNAIHMVVASRDGDVLFDGTLAANGNRMCGAVTYHGGNSFPMVAQKRPSTYPSPPQAERRQPSQSQPSSR